MNLIGKATVALAAFSTSIIPLCAQTASWDGRVAGTGRDLYVACYLLMADSSIEGQVQADGKFIVPHSAPACMTTQIAAMTAIPNGQRHPELGCYEIPNNAEVSANLAREIARIYVAKFEQSSEQLANVSGVAALIYVLNDKWACEN